jgi:uncharacterized protein (DUF2141 family)
MENTHSQNSASTAELPDRETRRSSGDRLPFETSLWKQNHGNWLLGFTAILCLLGASILACRQARFVPPSFPTNLNANRDNSNSDLSAEGLVSEDGVKLREVDVRIIGAVSDEGTMRIAMYIKSDGFNDPENALDTASWQIENGECVGKLQMPFEIEKLAVAAYHDANGNGELDRNALGIPSERYGFSNNARGITGPPTFEESVVTIGKQAIDISIR